jgi:hydrogenase expression/formation protein HypE
MAAASREAGVQIVTGDTKVVDRGRGHGVYINTSGVGFVQEPLRVLPARIEPGDVVLLSGDLARHGVAVLSVREGLQFETDIFSDCASLWPVVSRLVTAELDLHCMRDLTRGGLAAALNELALDAKLRIEIDEAAVAVDEAVAGACELLGLDPLYIACEGRFIVVLPERYAARALDALQSAPGGKTAAKIGRVIERVQSAAPGTVQLRSRLGTTRLVDLLSGEQLPRIC